MNALRSAFADVAAAAKKRAGVAIAPDQNECVIWRGDHARFIADNLVILGK